MQYQRYTDIQGWTPEIDSDGKDVDPKYLSDMENIDLYNSYATPAIAPTANIYSPLITTELQSSGYALVGVATYLHSVRGKVRVYVLWKTNSLRVYVYEFSTDTVTLVPFDYYGNGASVVTYISGQVPTKVNFSLVNEQLKINLNMQAYYPTLPNTPNIILNLTLLYLGSIVLTTGIQFDGWYLTPRWLGHSLSSDLTSTEISVLLYEDFSDATLETGFSTVGGTIVGGNWETLYGTEYIKVSNISNIKTVRIYVHTVTAPSLPIEFRVYSSGGGDPIYINRYEVLEGGHVWSFSPNIWGKSLEIQIGLPADSDLSTVPGIVLQIDTITLTGFAGSQMIMLGKNRDGQRYLLPPPSSPYLGLFDDYSIIIEYATYDWRLKEVELYIKINELYMLVGTALLEGAAYAAGNLVQDVVFNNMVESSTTLNFNYGLGETVSVDNQRNIYSEIFHKGRVYFTEETEKVYMSHLSGTGQAQPDSFPYDEEAEFGFFYLDVPESLIGLSVSQLDELCLHTAKNLFVYYIEASGGSIIRYYRQINGGTGISNANSITKSLGGKPVSEFNCWFDEDGVYAYGGGSQPPISLTRKTHYRYWKSLDKTNAFGFYVHSKREYWIVVEDIILIFEFDTAQFKKYRLPKQIKLYVEEISGVLHYIDIDSNPQQIDLINGDTYLTSYVETHYSSNKLITERGYQVEVGEYQIKITNEMFVSLLEKVVPAKNLTISFSFDNVEDYITITLPSDRASYLLLMPVIPYGKVKMKITLPAVKIRLGEFGYSYIMTKQANGQLN